MYLFCGLRLKSSKRKGGNRLDDLVLIRNNEATCSSLQVAAKFHKRHDKVLRAIDELLGGLPKNGETQGMFLQGSYTEKQNGHPVRKQIKPEDGNRRD